MLYLLRKNRLILTLGVFYMFFVTMGDPSGIGPEIILKALTHNMQLKPCHIVVIGSYDVLYYTAQKCNDSTAKRRTPTEFL